MLPLFWLKNRRSPVSAWRPRSTICGMRHLHVKKITAFAPNEKLKSPWLIALVRAKRMAASRRISACIGQAGTTQSPLFSREHFASRFLIVAYKCARLIEAWSLATVAFRPVGAEPICRGADQRWFVLATQAIPIECDNRFVRQKSNVFSAPVT